jgi:hypothetical protein
MAMPLAALPTQTVAQDLAWTMRATAGFATPTGNSLPPDTAFDVDTGLALSFDISRRLAGPLDAHLSFLSLTLPVELETVDGGLDTNGFRFSAIAIGVDVIVASRSAFQIYAGPLAAGVSKDIATVTGAHAGPAIATSGGWGLGAQIGLRVPGCAQYGRVTFAMNAQWLDLRLHTQTGARLPNPLVVLIGVSYSF